jgi:hypothetical protein
MAKTDSTKTTVTGDPRSLRNRVGAADRARLDVMHARAKKLAKLKNLTGSRYVEAMREMTGIVDQIVQMSVAYQENAHV